MCSSDLVGSTTFVDVFLLFGIEEDGGRIAFLMGYFAGSHSCSVITSYFDVSGGDAGDVDRAVERVDRP